MVAGFSSTVAAIAGVDIAAGGGSGPRRRATEGYRVAVSWTRFQSHAEASLRNPPRSGSCSISDAITAGSILNCWLVVHVDRHSSGFRV